MMFLCFAGDGYISLESVAIYLGNISLGVIII